MGFSLALRRNAAPVRDLPALLGLDLETNVLDKLMATAHVGLAYGEATHAGKTTIIPIGAVAYGFGWGRGGGGGKNRERGDEGFGGGGGGGGGVRVRPLAYLEIDGKGKTKLRPVLDWTAISVALIAALVPTIGVRALTAFRKKGAAQSAPSEGA